MHFFHLKKYWLIFLFIALLAPNSIYAAVCTPDGDYVPNSVAPFFGIKDFTTEETDPKKTPQSSATGVISKPDKTGNYKADQKFLRCEYATESFILSSMCYIQDAFNTSLFSLSCKLCHDLGEFFNIALQLFLVIYAFGFMTGIVQQQMGTFIKMVIKLSVVLILFNNHDAFVQIVYNGFMSISKMFFCLGVQNCGANNNILTDLDTILKLITGNGASSENMIRTMLGVFFVTWAFMWPVALLGVFFFGVLVTLRVILRFFVGVVLGILMLSMLLAFFCVFLIFFLFPYTKTFWARYITNITSYAAEPLFAVLTIFLILKMNIIPTAYERWKEGIGPIANYDLVIIPSAEHCNKPDKYKFAWGVKCPGAVKTVTNAKPIVDAARCISNPALCITDIFKDKYRDNYSLVLGKVPVLQHYSCENPSRSNECVCNKTAGGANIYCKDVMVHTIAFVLLFIIFVLSLESILKANGALVRHLVTALGLAFGDGASSASAPLAFDLGGAASGKDAYSLRKDGIAGASDAPYLIRGGIPFGQMARDVSKLRRLPGFKQIDNTLQSLPTQKGTRAAGRTVNNAIRTGLAFTTSKTAKAIRVTGASGFAGAFGGAIIAGPVGIALGALVAGSIAGVSIAYLSSRKAKAQYTQRLQTVKDAFRNADATFTEAKPGDIKSFNKQIKQSAIDLINSSDPSTINKNLEAAVVSSLSADRQAAYNTIQNARRMLEILNNSKDTFAKNRIQELLDKLEASFDNDNISDELLRALNLSLTTEALSSDNLKSTIKAFYDAQKADQLKRAADIGPDELKKAESIFANANTFESKLLEKALSDKDVESRKEIDKDYYNLGITLDVKGQNTQQRTQMYGKIASALDRIIANGALKFFD